MSGDEDTELRDLIMQTLDNNGVLGRIKAELRASVFLALEEEGSFREKIPILNKKLADFVKTSDGKKVVSLVREFLQFFDMHFTLCVFDPEVSADLLSRAELREAFNVTSDSSEIPVIAELLRSSKVPSSTTTNFTNRAAHRHGDDLNITDEFVSSNPITSSNSFTIETGDKKNANSKYHDPFFDEPLPSTKSSIFSTTETDNRGGDDNEFSDQPLDSKDSFYSFLKSTAKNDNLLAEGSHTPEKDDETVFGNRSKSSLSSLKDLPSLDNKSTDVSGWSYRKNSNKLPSLEQRLDESEVDKEDASASEVSIQSSNKSLASFASLGKPGNLDSRENSDQSIEEEVEEDLSFNADELLKSLSIGEDTTDDTTVSQISTAGGYDHIESLESSSLPKVT